MRTPMFTHDLGDGIALALRDNSTVERVHDLTVKNLDRLRLWEPWAQVEPDVESMRGFTRAGMTAWVEGRSIPCVIVIEDVVVGTAGATIDDYAQTAELGYWIDADHEGRGAVSRAVAALLSRLFNECGVRRAEIRTGTENARSRAVAHRLGFAHEGTLRAASQVGSVRQDVAVYGLLSESWADGLIQP